MKMFNIAQYLLPLVLAAAPLLAQQGSGDVEQWKAADAALGRSGQMQPGGVYKYAMPRKDLTVTKDGVTIAPGLLGSVQEDGGRGDVDGGSGSDRGRD